MNISGGAGSAINELLQQQNIHIPIINLGIPDRFIEHGTREECLSECGLNAEGIMGAVETFMQAKACQPQKNTLVF